MAGSPATATGDRWRAIPPVLASPSCGRCCCGTWPPRPCLRPPSSPKRSLSRFWFRIDEIRERFRDDLMRRWQRLRAAILEEGRRLVTDGEIDAPEDVFYLRGEDLESGASS